ncbi:MAG: cytochrome c [Gammaproteobacteria bacterium]|nr:cytochrome c [Gammaproteobacteria bacterium]
MLKNTIYLSMIALLTTACSGSNKFSPAPEMSGKEIFASACVECHKPVGESVMEISADMKDADKIANQVLGGSLMMPSFPNIQGESARKLAKYVVENSKTKMN